MLEMNLICEIFEKFKYVMDIESEEHEKKIMKVEHERLKNPD